MKAPPMEVLSIYAHPKGSTCVNNLYITFKDNDFHISVDVCLKLDVHHTFLWRERGYISILCASD